MVPAPSLVRVLLPEPSLTMPETVRSVATDPSATVKLRLPFKVMAPVPKVAPVVVPL